MHRPDTPKALDIQRLNHTLFYLWHGNPRESGNNAQWLGNAFAIGPHHCLTAKHVFRNADPANLYLVGGCLITPQKVKATPNSQPERDVALLEVDNGAPEFIDYLPLSPYTLASYLESAETLYSCGYVNTQESVQVFNAGVSQYNGEVSAYGLQTSVKQGRSGGCLLNKQAQVVGVVFASSNEQNNHYAIALDSFRSWLKELLALPEHSPNSVSSIQQQSLLLLRKGENLNQALLQQLQISPVTDATTYALKHYALRSQDKKLDEGFVKLELLADYGADNEQGRFQKQQESDDLLELINEREEVALALIGRPGNGKTILLKHLELQLCELHLKNPEIKAPLPFYVQLNQYPPRKQPEPSPLEWLSHEWQWAYPKLPPLQDFMRQQPMLLLLDALNEMKVSAEGYEEKIRDWRALLKTLQKDYPGSRACFSCRTADYSGVLSDERETPVPQIHFKDLSDDVIREFLNKHLGESAEELANALLAINGLELKTPFYLDLAVRFYKDTGKAPAGASQLIAAMIWSTLATEYEKDAPSPLFSKFINPRDLKQLAKKDWIKQPHKLPKRSPLIAALIQLAWAMQSANGGEKEISLEDDEIIDVFLALCDNDDNKADNLLALAESLDFLVPVADKRTWKFSHQLLQEYFAAQHQVTLDNLALLNKPWQKAKAMPDLQTTVDTLNIADPLPFRASSGWEETSFHAVALAKNPWQFIEQVQQQDVVLAARCSRHPEIVKHVPVPLKSQLQQALLSLSQNPEADLRARLEAGLELGQLGDPRFKKQQGKDAAYIPPPLAKIAAGDYWIGSEEGDDDEKPLHQVSLAAFSLGQYPVTNAEWQCFMDAGGYKDERWWQTESAKAWQQGTLEQTDQIDWYLNRYKAHKDDFDGTCQRYSYSDLARHQWQENLDNWPEEADFEAVVREQFKPQKYTHPSEWFNPRFNNPTQPLVGICWYEALAYCHWLSYQSGQRFHLPTEAQWQAAAGGTKAMPFPWGKQSELSLEQPLANCLELHLRRSTPVGMLSKGASISHSEKLYDLGGNVWEWCLSLYQDYPITDQDTRDNLESDKSRVMRGGAWVDLASWARAAYRGGIHPNNRSHYVGFRVLCSPPSLFTGS